MRAWEAGGSVAAVYQRKDPVYTRAKSAGYRSRAAYKLQQLVEHRRLLRRGDCVVELGAWPGGWLQVASQRVGPKGRVIGVDVQPIEPVPGGVVATLVADIADPRAPDHVAQMCGRKADVLLSDLAPKLSGVRARDEAQMVVLADYVLEWAARILKPGGHLIVKLFTSNDVAGYVERLRDRFRDVHLTRPEATRKGSAELYAVAIAFRGPAKAA